MIAYEQAPNWVGVKKEIGDQSLQGVAWGRKTGLCGRGEGGGGAVDFVLMPPIGLLAICYPVTHMSVTCQLGYETDQIHLHAREYFFVNVHHSFVNCH